jgi:Uma2 family endonuclease
MSRTTPLATVDEVRAMPEQGSMIELVSGEPVNREAPTEAHEVLIERLREVLSAHVEESDLGAVFRSPWPVELSRYDLVKPDLCFVAWGRDGVIAVDGVHGAPELVVEVLSPESRDRDLGEKQRLYAWAGVFEYWVVDPEARLFQAMIKGRQGYDPIELSGTRFRSVLLPDFELDLESLFAECD